MTRVSFGLIALTAASTAASLTHPGWTTGFTVGLVVAWWINVASDVWYDRTIRKLRK